MRAENPSGLQWGAIALGAFLVYEWFLKPTTTRPLTDPVLTYPNPLTPAPAPAPVRVTSVPPAMVNNPCPTGFSQDAAGVCTRYSDANLLQSLNAILWTGTNDIPVEQINRIDPQILAQYGAVIGVTPGSVLAYMLGLGNNPVDGAVTKASDGNTYQVINGQFVRQSAGMSGLGRTSNFRMRPRGMMSTTIRMRRGA